MKRDLNADSDAQINELSDPGCPTTSPICYNILVSNFLVKVHDVQTQT